MCFESRLPLPSSHPFSFPSWTSEPEAVEWTLDRFLAFKRGATPALDSGPNDEVASDVEAASAVDAVSDVDTISSVDTASAVSPTSGIDTASGVDVASAVDATSADAGSGVDLVLAYLVLTAIIERSLKNLFAAISPNKPTPHLLRCGRMGGRERE